MGSRLRFADETFDFELLRTMGHAPYGGADLGECLAAADRVGEGDVEAWHRAWRDLGERVRAEAAASLAGGHRVSARGGFLRAANYFRAAEFFLHADPADPRILATWRASRDAFARALPLLPCAAEAVEIPYEGTTLEGHVYRPAGDVRPRRTLVFHGGLDSTLEELWFAGAAAAVERGWACLTFSGPGQGRAIREQGLPFRPDWEAVVRPVVDFALGLPGVDPGRVALLGWSLGGLLAPRAAAFEPRLAALVAWDGAFDNFAAGLAMLPVADRAEAEAALRRDPRAFDPHLNAAAAADTGAWWAVTHGMWAFGADSPSALIAAGADYHLRDCAARVACPTLVCEGADDPFWRGQPRQLFDALACPKTFLRFTADEGAAGHCQTGALTLFHQRAFDWLDEAVG